MPIWTEGKQKCSFELEGNRRASFDLRTCKSVNLDYYTQQKCWFGLDNTAEVSAMIGGHNESVGLKWRAQQNRRLEMEDTTEGRFGSEATTEDTEKYGWTWHNQSFSHLQQTTQNYDIQISLCYGAHRSKSRRHCENLKKTEKRRYDPMTSTNRSWQFRRLT